MDHQNSYGCRECSNGNNLCAFGWPSARRARGRKLLTALGPANRRLHLIMDRAYEGDETRQLALDLGFVPVVPPKSNRITAWHYSKAIYKRRNEIERLFRRLKGFRRIFSRFEKLDVMFSGFIHFALIADALR